MSKKSNPVVYEINRVPVPEDIPYVYTDASFKSGVGCYAFTVVTNDDMHTECDLVPEVWLSENSRSCELYGVLAALEYCSKKKYPEIGLFFDYVGIYSLLVPRPGDPAVYKLYAQKMSKLSSKMNVYYHKVDESNDLLDLVDMISRAHVRLVLGGKELVKYRQFIQQRKTSNKK